VLAAQDKVQTKTQEDSQEKGIRTLHVYANLIQLPVLVLNWTREPLKRPVPENKFYVSVDSGPWFRATHVRLEGDDPISLSILLDVSGDVRDLMPKMDEAIAELAPLSLRPRDHVSIYALNCTLVRSLVDDPAAPGLLKAGTASVLESWTDRKKNKHREDCKSPVHLWDALSFITSQLYDLPGRRVVLVVTDGNGADSLHTWKQVGEYAQETGVAVFGMTYMLGPYRPPWSGTPENALTALCELSGGMVLMASSKNLEERLQQFVATVRERYIVEFPRPYRTTAGAHLLAVKVDKADDFIRPAGISVPIADPKLLSDPTTVLPDPSLAPEMGKRRILTSK
jgi:hypothetical protein